MLKHQRRRTLPIIAATLLSVVFASAADRIEPHSRIALEFAVMRAQRNFEEIAGRYREKHPLYIEAHMALQKATQELEKTQGQTLSSTVASSADLKYFMQTALEQEDQISALKLQITTLNRQLAAIQAKPPEVAIPHCTINVLGAVNSAGAFDFTVPPTILEAFSRAGGINRIANLATLRIIRIDGTVLPIKAKQIEDIPRIPLQDRDTIWIDYKLF